jgi:hypothetical protein
VLTPDLRAEGEEGDWSMWSGQLKAEEWERLQFPGEILSRQRTFREHAVDEVLEQYLGYKLGRGVDAVGRGRSDIKPWIENGAEDKQCDTASVVSGRSGKMRREKLRVAR